MKKIDTSGDLTGRPSYFPMASNTIPETIFDLTADPPGARLDQFVAASVPALSRTEAQRLIKAGRILVNDRLAKSSYRLEPGDAIRVTIPPSQSREVAPEDIPLDILYEDADLVAIDKPTGMVVHPAYGNLSGTLVNAALARWPEMRRITGEERAGIVHRLDKDTSGVMVLAKTPDALKALQEQFKSRSVYKRYIALVDGIPDSPAGLIDAPIGRDSRQRKRMAVIKKGRLSQTRYDVLEIFADCALLSLEPATGRTHQLRVHLSWLGYPIVADPVYGHRKQRVECPRLFLHASVLQVNSPSSGLALRFESPLPSELEQVLRLLRAGIR